MRANGTLQQSLTDPLPGEVFSWAPGNRILFLRDSRVYAMNADGSAQAELTSPPSRHWDHSAQWSPDGQTLAFIRMLAREEREPGNDPLFVGNIWVLERDATAPRQVTSFPAEVGPDITVQDYTWSPDGSRLAFSTVASGFDDIFIIGVDGAGEVNLTQSSARTEYAPKWSPDGQRILFTGYDKAEYGSSPVSTDVYVINADGSNVRNLSDNPSPDTGGEWRP
jgi:TolB protein